MSGPLCFQPVGQVGSVFNRTVPDGLRLRDSVQAEPVFSCENVYKNPAP